MKAFYILIVLIIVVNALLAALFVGCIILPDHARRKLATIYYFIGLQLYIQIGIALGTSLWRYKKGEKYKDYIE